MPKQLEITSELEARIRAASGDDNLDVTSLAVFETVLADSRPLNKRGSLFDKGRISRTTLAAMVGHLGDGTVVPLHTLHRYGDEMPVGRVFHAQVFDTDDGEAELIGQFFVPKHKAELVADIDTGTLNSVSVGVLSEKLLCSECGWDYRGEDATFLHLWDRTCANDHTIGKDGVHVRLTGLDAWMETSLVSEGAVPRAKIASRSAAKLDAGELERLAASNIDPRAIILTADFKEKGLPMSGTKDGAHVDPMALVSQLTKASSDLALAQASLAGKEQEIEGLKAKITNLETQLEAAGTPNEELQAQLATANKVADDAKAALTEHCKAALIASGKADQEVPEDVTAMLSIINEAGVKLHQLIPEGGRGRGATDATDDETEQKDRRARLSAFKLAR